MARTDGDAAAGANRSLWMGLGIVLLAAGLSGHLLAARAIGGYYVAYRDHVFGFVLGMVVFGGIMAVLGRRFWRGRPDMTVLLLGVLQAIFGLVVYVNRYHLM